MCPRLLLRGAVHADQLEGVTRQDHVQPGAPGHALEARHDCGDAGRLHLTSGQGAYACVLPLKGPALGPIEGDRADRAYSVQPAAVGAIRPDVAVTPNLIAA